jgi:hypothetical protein
MAGTAERKRERSYRNGGSGSWFVADFEPDFLLSQAIKSASIYRQWKRVILSAPE